MGFAAFLPLYLRRAMGAGDVKLMAAVGSFFGPLSALGAAAASLVAGAFLGIGYLAWRRYGASRYGLLTIVGASEALSAARTERFPYAAAIAAGTVAVLAHEGRLAGLLTGAY